MRWLATLLSCLAILFAAGATSAVAQSADDVDAQTAGGAAIAISRLEAQQHYDAVYDLLNPDAQVLIPRSAVVGWYQDTYAGKTTTPLSVISVTFGDWAWPVTGKTYSHVAEVHYVQSFWDADGNREDVSDVEHLARVGHIWTWFFGLSREFVDEQAAKYGAVAIESSMPIPASTARDACNWTVGAVGRLQRAQSLWQDIYPAIQNGNQFELIMSGARISQEFSKLATEERASNPPASVDGLSFELEIGYNDLRDGILGLGSVAFSASINALGSDAEQRIQRAVASIQNGNAALTDAIIKLGPVSQACGLAL